MRTGSLRGQASRARVPPPVFLQNKARREDFCPRKLRQMHLVIDQLMAHSHLRYKGEGPRASPTLANGLIPEPALRPTPADWGPEPSLTVIFLPPSPPLAASCLQADGFSPPGTLSMLQCNIFPGLPPDFLDSEVNLFLVPFMDSEAESENPPRAGEIPLQRIGPQGDCCFLGLDTHGSTSVRGRAGSLRADRPVAEVLGPFLRSTFQSCRSTGRAGLGLN